LENTVLPYKSVSELIQTTFPGMVRSSAIDLHTDLYGDFLVGRNFLSIIVCHRFTERWRNIHEDFDGSFCDSFGGASYFSAKESFVCTPHNGQQRFFTRN